MKYFIIRVITAKFIKWIQMNSTATIPVKVQILITLRFLATAGSDKSLMCYTPRPSQLSPPTREKTRILLCRSPTVTPATHTLPFIHAVYIFRY